MEARTVIAYVASVILAAIVGYALWWLYRWLPRLDGRYGRPRKRRK